MGTAFTAVTAGSRAGALTLAARTPGQRTLGQAAKVMVAVMIVVAVAPTIPIAFAGLAGLGFAWSYFLGSVIAILQTAEPAMMGRVMSLFAVVLLGGTAAGGPMAASLSAITGPRAPFVVGAVAAVAAAAIIRRWQRDHFRGSLADLWRSPGVRWLGWRLILLRVGVALIRECQVALS